MGTKPTYFNIDGALGTPEPDAPCLPIYLLSVYLERDPETLQFKVSCLALRSDPQLSRHRGDVIGMLRRALYREEKCLHLGGRRPVDALREDVLREDVLREDVLREDVLSKDGSLEPFPYSDTSSD